MKWTKPRSKETPAKELRRLKPGSVPSKMLILERKENTKEKRKDMSQNESSFEQNKKIKVNHISTRTGIPTYTKLIQFAKEKQNEIEQSMEAETVESIQDVYNMEKEAIESVEKDNLQCTRECIKNITEQNDTMKLDMNKEITNKDIPRETLLIHIRTSKKEKQQLFAANQNLELKNQELNMQITQLRDEMTKIGKGIQKEVKSKATDVLRKVFTPGQISALMSSTSNRVKWSSEDIMSAISLRSLSPKAYKYLRNVKKILLPCPTTLYNWVAKFNVLPGTLKDVINIMSSIGHNLSTTEKLTVITFDDMYISNKLDIDQKHQQVYGPHKTCMFIMARGLFKKWRQPIYYNFDISMNRNVLFTVIQVLYEIDYIVVAITCDMGSNNMKLWKELHIGVENGSSKNKTDIETNCFIMHPSNESLKILFYADVPHLLKLARNNFLDSGFNIKENFVDKTCLEQLLALENNELKISHKLSTLHLDVKGTKRQNVKLAAQIFSNTNALAIRWCGENDLLDNTQWQQTCKILQLFNDWFDIFNSNLKYSKCSTANAYGINIEEQNKIINNMNEFIMEMRVGQRKSLLQFQKGILLCNRSIQEMFAHLQAKYSSEIFDVKYILTRRLNQDILENFFSYIRSMGSGYDHPTPVEVKNRLKWYILGKHSEHVLSGQKNTEEDSSCDSLITMTDIHSPDSICVADRLPQEEYINRYPTSCAKCQSKYKFHNI